MLVSQREFDRARAEAGIPDFPSARACAQRLRMSWPEIVAIAVSPERDAIRNMRLNARVPRNNALTLDQVVIALKTVAGHLGKKRLRPHEYEQGRAALNARNRRAWLHGRQLHLQLPTQGQILAVATWSDACAAAALDTNFTQEPTQQGYSILEMTLLFIRELDALPTRPHGLATYARKKGYRFVSPGRHQSEFRAALETACDQLTKHGEQIPVVRLTERQVRALTLEPDPTSRIPRVRTRSFEDCWDAIDTALDLLPVGEHLTQRVYRRLAKDQPDMPPMSVIDAHARKHATTFSTMRDALIMKRAERIAASSL